MKKLYILLVFILQASFGFAATITDYYPEQTLAVFCFDAKWASKTMGYTGKNNEFSKAYQEAVKCLKERISFDIEKDFSRMGVFVVPGGENITAVGVLTGKFNTKNNVALLEKALADSKSQIFQEETISVAGKKVKAFSDGNSCFIFYNDDVVLYCFNKALDDFAKNRITFTQAPDDFADLINKSEFFLYVSKNVTPYLQMLRVPPQMAQSINSFVSYFDNEDIKTEVNFNDPELANQIHAGINGLIQFYNNYYNAEFEKNKNSLQEKSVGDMADTVISMFAGAKAKDLVDALEITVNGNTLVISTKLDGFKLIGGVLGGVLSAAMKSPQFAQARSTSKLKACYSNARVLQGAVEMYNMDHSTMMSNLDIPTLVKEHYLKSEPGKPEPECEYYNVGDLTGEGYIACKKHGSPFQQQE